MTSTTEEKKKRGRPAKLKIVEDAQEPLDKFRKGAAAKLGKADASSEDLSKSNDLIDTDRDGQKRIPGTERKGNKKIEEQARVVQDLQGERQQILDQEIKERDKLTQMMQRAGIEQYDLDENYEAVIDRGEPKAKVHKKKKVKLTV